MRTDITGLVRGSDAARRVAATTIHSDAGRLRTLAVAAGVCWSVLFVIIGLRYELQMYGDGSIFAYAVLSRMPGRFTGTTSSAVCLSMSSLTCPPRSIWS